jgi:prepilin-type N-terminal cleavage/methylation domain-containing protein
MAKAFLSARARGKGSWASFSLIEMLFVMGIIAILASMILYAAASVMYHSARNRAQTEIQAMSTALDDYKIDNGAYPIASGSSGWSGPPSGTYPLNPAMTTAYQNSATVLYLALAGRANLTDTPVSTVKSYINFKTSQVGLSINGSYVVDPWSYPYGYNSGDGTSGNVPYAGQGYFDLWSTGNSTTSTNSWITTWGQ